VRKVSYLPRFEVEPGFWYSNGLWTNDLNPGLAISIHHKDIGTLPRLSPARKRLVA
jgi:hypothetical protein